MIYKSFSYLSYILTSKNQHGVHSPFVFDFVTKALYQKLPKNFKTIPEVANLKVSKKQQNLIHKTLTYFKINNLNIVNNTSSFSVDDKCKCFYINILESNTIKAIIASKSFFVIIIPNIYQSTSTHQKWIELIKHQNFTISIDLFYLGLIFYRPQQEQEHFKIRV